MRLVANLAAILFMVTTVLAPLAAVLAGALAHPHPAGGTGFVGWDAGLFSRSLAWAFLIAILAAIWAVPAGWFLARRGRWWLILPMLLVPSYLAYSGWGLIRAPGTFVGDWIERAAEGDRRWIPIVVNRGLAILGLSFWSAPIAALVIASGVRRIALGVEEALEIEELSSISRWWQRMRLVRKEILIALALVTALMLGSAVPLHLAQVETYSTKLWLMLDQTAASDRWKIWVSAWPVLLVGLLAGAGFWRLLDHSVEPLEGSRSRSPRGRIGFALLLSSGVLAPLVFFAMSIRNPSSFRNVWVVSREAIGSSALVMSFVGLGCVFLAALVASGVLVRPVRWLLGLGLSITALVPGVLVGAAMGTALSAAPDWVGDSACAVILAHLARFGILGVICGELAARAETVSEQDARKVDGGVGIKGWLVACLPWQWGLLLCGGLCGAALSLHEIESTIMVTPPGMDTLARQMLQHLHFARTEELSVTSVMVVLAGGLFALAASLAQSSAQDRAMQRSGPAAGSINDS